MTALEQNIKFVISLWTIDLFVGTMIESFDDEFKSKFLERTFYWLSVVKQQYGDNKEVEDIFYKLAGQKLEHLFNKNIEE